MTVYLAIPLRKGHYAIVDRDCGNEILKRKWSFAKVGYAICNWKGRNTLTYLHRKIINAGNGKIVDHINRDKLDNRRDNLRIVSHAKNILNQNSNNVYYCAWVPSKPWRVIVGRKSFGYFKDKDEAIKLAKIEKEKMLNEIE